MVEKKLTEELKRGRKIADPKCNRLKENIALAQQQKHVDWFYRFSDAIGAENAAIRDKIRDETGEDLLTLYPELKSLSEALRNQIVGNNNKIHMIATKHTSLGLSKEDAKGQIHDLRDENYMLDRVHFILDGESPLAEFEARAEGILGSYRAINHVLDMHVTDEEDPEGIWLQDHSFDYNSKIYQLSVTYTSLTGETLR